MDYAYVYPCTKQFYFLCSARLVTNFPIFNYYMPREIFKSSLIVK